MSDQPEATPLDVKEPEDLQAEIKLLRWQVEQMERINREMFGDGTALYDELMDMVERNDALSNHMIRQAERLEASKHELMTNAWREGRDAGWNDRGDWDRTFEFADATYFPTPNPYEETQEMPWQM